MLKLSCRFLIFFTLFISLTSHAEQELWFGSYTDEEGKICQGRYFVEFDSERMVALQLAPYGKEPIDINIASYEPEYGVINLEWAGNPEKTCVLIQYHKHYYAGNWIEGTTVQPMVLKKFDRTDAQRQGNEFEIGEIELQIIEYAMEKLSDETNWNRNDDRICEGKDSVSLFCALYDASIALDGEYRHLRPAIKAVRDAIEERHPKKYSHILQDFNNAEETTLEEVLAVLDLARDRLASAMVN